MLFDGGVDVAPVIIPKIDRKLQNDKKSKVLEEMVNVNLGELKSWPFDSDWGELGKTDYSRGESKL